MTEAARALADRLSGLDHDLHGEDLLLTWERSPTDLEAVLVAAEAFETLWRDNVDCRVFGGGLAVSIFRDQSTRTRFSYASAASLLGLTAMDLDEKKSQIAHGETVRETANMISFLTEAIGIRDDMFLGAGHEYMVEVADAVTRGHEEGVLPQRPAVVNLQCDRDHPTQTLSDLMHLRRTFGSLAALEGRKVAMSWAYSPSYGKPLSVPQGIVGLLTRYGMEVTLAHPPGYEIDPEIVGVARRQASDSGGSFQVVDDMTTAFEGADVVYPKSWAPYDVMKRRTELLRGGRSGDLAALEKECLAQNAEHRHWECDEPKMAATRDGEALYMHCLPADISDVSCEHGEVTASVFERCRKATYLEAEHKPYVIAAMILLSRCRRPHDVIGGLVDRAATRRPD